MAVKARDTDEAQTRSATQQAGQGGTTGVAEEVRPGQPAEGRFEGRRSATVNLPFVTAQFRAPQLRAPTREDVGAAARGARSMLPSGKSMLFFGGLAATAIAGVIEWPVAAAIGVGGALASRGEINPTPAGRTAQPSQAQTTGTGRPETGADAGGDARS